MDQSTPQPIINPIATPEISPETSQKPKKNKLIIIILSVFLAISLIAAGVFAYLYFSSQNDQEQSQDNSSNIIQEEVTISEEAEIDDEALKKDLDNKIAILFNTDDTSPTFATGRGVGYYDETLFQNGDISQSNKVRSLIKHAMELRPLNEQEIAAAVAQSGFDGENEKYFRQETPLGIDGDQVVQKYKEIFGEEFIKGPIATVCGEYEYNATYDFYYVGLLGCGGTTPFERFYYKNRYTTDEKHAYVYTSTAFLAPTFSTGPNGSIQDSEPFHIYCDIADLKGDDATEITKNAKECATIQTYEEAKKFTLDSSNYEQYSRYRFVFNKSEEGNYHFNKVEKL